MDDRAQSSKQALRQNIAATLRSIPAAELAAKSAAICQLIQAMPLWQSANRILSYSALFDEVDVSALAGPNIAYPRIVGSELEAWLPEPGAVLTRGPLGILAPSEEDARLISPSELDLILVPGRLFHKNGTRLGRGKGFYDRYLAQPSVRAVRVGVCFSIQLSEEIIPDPWDVPMNWIVHEAGAIECGKT